jgi:hypothetical protein
MTDDRELCASIAAIGPLLPLLVWQGVTIDGRKREIICAELGLVPRVRVLQTLEEACQALWALHPDRAVELAHKEWDAGDRSPLLSTVARLCGARVALVALIVNGKKPKVTEKRSPRRTRSVRTELVRFWCDPQLKHYIKRAGEAERLELSAAIRVACWEYVQRVLPRAATEGTERGPAVEYVRPRERRRVR